MNQDRTVYDLGVVRLDEDVLARQPKPRSVPRREAGRALPDAEAGAGSAVSGSLSLFVPGCGQLVVGDVASGLFFLTGVGFCGAFLWAILSSIERIVPTASLLGIGPTAVAIAAIVAFFAGAMLHVAAVLHADGLHDAARRLPHPVTAGIASLLVPGWGQLLSGHRRRVALFLLALWVAAGAWAVVSPAASHVLAELRLELPVWLREGAGPIVLVGLPVLTWIVAVYDAAAGAAMERNRSR
jgi:hypothetical protein